MTLPLVALACKPGSIAAVTSRRGCVVTGTGDAVKVMVDVAVTEWFAFDVAVRVYVPAVGL
jgi:hypothetical protein